MAFCDLPDKARTLIYPLLPAEPAILQSELSMGSTS